MARIINQSIKKFEAGYLISTLNKVGNFTPDTKAVKFGRFLKYGSGTKRYDMIEELTGLTAENVVGVSLRPQTKAGNTYPGSITELPMDNFGDVLEMGDVAVVVSDSVTDPDTLKEGAVVYLDTKGLATADSTLTGALKLPKFTFLGITDTVDGVLLAAVRKAF